MITLIYYSIWITKQGFSSTVAQLPWATQTLTWATIFSVACPIGQPKYSKDGRHIPVSKHTDFNTPEKVLSGYIVYYPLKNE